MDVAMAIGIDLMTMQYVLLLIGRGFGNDDND